MESPVNLQAYWRYSYANIMLTECWIEKLHSRLFKINLNFKFEEARFIYIFNKLLLYLITLKF